MLIVDRQSKAPRFIRKPRSTEVVEGDSLVIICEVVGDPKPDVIWLRDWLNVSRTLHLKKQKKNNFPIMFMCRNLVMISGDQ